MRQFQLPPLIAPLIVLLLLLMSPILPARAITWGATPVYTHDFTSDANQTAGGALSHVIDDGKWEDVQGGRWAVASGRLVGTNSGSAPVLIRDPALTPLMRDMRIVYRIAAGDTIAANFNSRSVLAPYVTLPGGVVDYSWLTTSLAGNGLLINPEFRVTDPWYVGSPSNAGGLYSNSLGGSNNFSYFPSTNYYDVEVLSTGNFPRSFAIRVFNQGPGPTPPALGTTPAFSAITAASSTSMTDSSASWTTNQYQYWSVEAQSPTGVVAYTTIASNTATVLTLNASSNWAGVDNTWSYRILPEILLSNGLAGNASNDYYSSAEGANDEGVPGLMPYGASAAPRFQAVAIYKNTDIQPAYPTVLSNNSAGIKLSAYDFNPNKTGDYAQGGSGSYTYYWHVSTTASFTPSAGTRTSTAITNPGVPWLYSGVAPNTSYYVALETFDGTNSVYTYVGYSGSANQPIVSYDTSSTAIRGVGFGHSYIQGSGATGVGASSRSMVNEFANLLTNNNFGTGARSTTMTNQGFGGANMFQFAPRAGALYRRAVQAAEMAGADTCGILLTTNDVAGAGWTKAAVTSYYNSFLSDLKLDAPDIKYVFLMAAPPIIGGTPESTYQTFAAGQLAATDNAYSYMIGLDLIDAFNTSNTSKESVFLPASSQGVVTSYNSSTFVITDTHKTGGTAWTTNQFQATVPLTIKIVGGTGAGQTNTIASNTSNTITCSGAWTTNPDSTSSFIIPLYSFGNIGITVNTTDSPQDQTYGGWVGPESPLLFSDNTHPSDFGHYQFALRWAAKRLEVERQAAAAPRTPQTTRKR